MMNLVNNLTYYLFAALMGVIAVAFLVLIHVRPGLTKLYRIGIYLSTCGAIITFLALMLAPAVLTFAWCLFGVGLLLSTFDAIHAYWLLMNDVNQIRAATSKLVVHCLVAAAAMLLIWVVALSSGRLPQATMAPKPTTHATQ